MNTKHLFGLHLFGFCAMVLVLSGQSMAEALCPKLLTHSQLKALRDRSNAVWIDGHYYQPLDRRSKTRIGDAVKSSFNPKRLIEINRLVPDDSYSNCTYTYGTVLRNQKAIENNVMTGDKSKVDATFTIRRIEKNKYGSYDY